MTILLDFLVYICYGVISLPSHYCYFATYNLHLVLQVLCVCLIVMYINVLGMTLIKYLSFYYMYWFQYPSENK